MGDFNGDKKVNILDGVRIAHAWNGLPADARWNEPADLNHDNAVNILEGSRISLYARAMVLAQQSTRAAFILEFDL